MINNILDTYLHGTHDIGSEHLHEGAPGWILSTEALGLNLNVQGRNYSHLAEQGFNVVGRLNVGYGNDQGTIPYPEEYDLFARTCGAFVARSKGCRIWIIGNEPNHEAERKQGRINDPNDVARLVVMAQKEIKRVDPTALVLAPPIAPYHANPTKWTDYARAMLLAIHRLGGCGGWALHAYTRTDNPADIASPAKMQDPPLQDTYSGFLTYLDALKCVPPEMPLDLCIISEFDRESGYSQSNTGIYRAAVEQIYNHNLTAPTFGVPFVQAVIAYRWDKDEWAQNKWTISTNPGMQEDIRQAAHMRRRPPALPAWKGNGVVIPPQPELPPELPPVNPPVQPIDKYPVAWDPALDARGVDIIKWVPNPSDQQGFRVKAGEWWDVEESRGLHHIFLEVTDQGGKRLEGIEFKVTWPNANPPAIIKTRANPGERYAADFPMSASLHEFSVEPLNAPGDKVTGIGMGKDGNPKEHTSTWLYYEYGAVPVVVVPAPTPTPTPTAPTLPNAALVPDLFNPFANQEYPITQPYGRGVNAQVYSKFKVDGVPLQGHNGVDFGCPSGTPLYAVDGGQVVEAAFDPAGFGWYAKLRHRWGESLYAHLSELGIGLGNVQRGQYLGRSGNTGNSTGPHLHFGLRVNPFNRQDGMGGYTDPMPYLKGVGEKQESTEAPQVSNAVICDIIEAVVKQMGWAYGWEVAAAQAWAESSFRSEIRRNDTGAMGLFQITQNTWDEWAPQVGVNDPYNPEHSTRVAIKYMQYLLPKVGNDLRMAYAVYGWGIGNYQKLGGDAAPIEWKHYADKIIFGRDFGRAILGYTELL